MASVTALSQDFGVTAAFQCCHFDTFDKLTENRSDQHGCWECRCCMKRTPAYVSSVSAFHGGRRTNSGSNLLGTYLKIVPAHFIIVISTNGRNLPFFDEQRGAETKRISPVGRNDRLGGINLVFG
jgi:hypothetical protein